MGNAVSGASALCKSFYFHKNKYCPVVSAFQMGWISVYFSTLKLIFLFLNSFLKCFWEHWNVTPVHGASCSLDGLIYRGQLTIKFGGQLTIKCANLEFWPKARSELELMLIADSGTNLRPRSVPAFC